MGGLCKCYSNMRGILYDIDMTWMITPLSKIISMVLDTGCWVINIHLLLAFQWLLGLGFCYIQISIGFWSHQDFEIWG
jgi:hypothetical protein